MSEAERRSRVELEESLEAVWSGWTAGAGSPGGQMEPEPGTGSHRR